MASADAFMAGMGFLRGLWLTRLSQPAAERPLYRHVLRSRPRRILEIGLGLLVRTPRLLEAAGGAAEYVGLDRFEARTVSDPPGVSLKTAHKRLQGLGRVQLVPGHADASLARRCNHLGTFDLVMVTADADARDVERSWPFLQRMTTAATTVFVESRAVAGSSWGVLPRQRLDELAAKAGLRRAG